MRQARLLEADVCTSNYRKQGRNRNAVRISVGRPADFEGSSYEPLIPPEWLVNGYKTGTVKRGEYLRVYREQLGRLSPRRIVDDLHDKVVLCYCPEGSFCHRFVFADWLRENGYSVVEI